jgi:DNA mismatch endonuclease (patch repair protein)
MSRWPGDARKERTTFGLMSRSQLMSRVRSKGNRSTEGRLAMLLREWRLSGWRRHRPLFGSPDFAWPAWKVAVFVDGCFWHGHACGKNLSPKTNAKEWKLKLTRNQLRDRRVTRALRRQGWRVVRLWECQLARDPNKCMNRIRRSLAAAQGSRKTPQLRSRSVAKLPRAR